MSRNSSHGKPKPTGPKAALFKLLALGIGVAITMAFFGYTWLVGGGWLTLSR